MTSTSRRALLHPLWWAALLALAVNDHLFKHGLEAAWLTGKLSDFAGMIVAPVLMASVLRTRSAWQRAFAFAVVVIPFAAMNLSVDAAEGMVGLVGLVGISWRIWTDPTDLVALGVLPLAWWLCAPRCREGDAAGAGVFNCAIHRVGTLVGGIACLATIGDPESPTDYETAAYLVNATHSDIEVDVYRPIEPLDCASFSSATVDPEVFGFDKCRVAEPFEIVPLDHDWWSNEHENRDDRPPRACDAVVIRMRGLSDTLIFWKDELQVSVSSDDTAGHFVDDPHSVLLERGGDVLYLSPGETLDVWEVDWDLPESEPCEGAP